VLKDLFSGCSGGSRSGNSPGSYSPHSGQGRVQKKKYGNLIDIKVTSRMVCAAVPEGGKDACARDGGGPVVIKKSGKQVGVVSWGFGCTEMNAPGVSGADKEIHDFIDSELKELA